MTKPEIKNSIVAQINQQAVAQLTDQLADLVLENEALKQRVAELEKPAPKPEPTAV